MNVFTEFHWMIVRVIYLFRSCIFKFNLLELWLFTLFLQKYDIWFIKLNNDMPNLNDYFNLNVCLSIYLSFHLFFSVRVLEK